MELDKQRIRRKLKPMQAESIIAVATVGPPMANSLGKDPYVTADAVARVSGGKAATVRTNLKVLDYPGSPVSRVTVPMGTKSLTAYDFAGMDTPALLTALGDFAENLGAPPKLSRERVRCHHCPEGTTQTAATICDGCHRVLARRKLEAPNVQKNTTLETPPRTVDVLRTYRAGKHHVGAADGAQHIDVRNVRKTRVLSDEPPPKRCPANGCRAMEFRQHSSGSWRCLKSGHDSSMYPHLAAVLGGSE